jgi:multisubunit Na+/H+ antiporter MnhB subunit
MIGLVLAAVAVVLLVVTESWRETRPNHVGVHRWLRLASLVLVVAVTVSLAVRIMTIARQIR